MSKITGAFDRFFKYVIHGVPTLNTNVTVSQINYGGILKDKNILITGGSRGLGYAIAKKCIAEGAKVVITGRSIDTLITVQNELGTDKCNVLEFDVRDVKLFADKIREAANLLGGRIDCLVNNAGISIHGINYKTCTEEDWDKQMDTNLKGIYFLTQEFIKHYHSVKNTSGNIIMMTSERGLYGDDVPYGISKAGLISYTKGLSKKLILDGIRVNAVAPGVTATNMTNYDPNDNLYRKSAIGLRVLLPEEIAEVVTFLLSDASKCVSGAVINCNEANHLR